MAVACLGYHGAGKARPVATAKLDPFAGRWRSANSERPHAHRFLASDEAGHMMGQTISPNGGDVLL